MRGASRRPPYRILSRVRPGAFSRAQSVRIVGLAAVLGAFAAAAGAAPPALEVAGELPTTVQLGDARAFQGLIR